MADLDKILKDGSETGGSVADKVNAGFTKTDAVMANFTAHAGDKHLHLTFAQNKAIDENPALAAGNKVIDQASMDAAIQIVAAALASHGTDNTKHLTPDENDAIDGTINPLSAANPIVDKALFQAGMQAITDNLENHEVDFTKHMGTDQNNAFDGANSPSALNPLATMGDLTPFATHVATAPLHLTSAMYDGLHTANAPSLANAFATMNDIPAAPAPPPPAHFQSLIINTAIAGVKPTKAECAIAFETITDFDYAVDTEFYMRDNTGTVKLFHIIYMSEGDTDVTGTNYQFRFERMSLAN